MATQFMLDAPVTGQRLKKTARPCGVRVTPEQVVRRLLDTFPDDMARLAE